MDTSIIYQTIYSNTFYWKSFISEYNFRIKMQSFFWLWCRIKGQDSSKQIHLAVLYKHCLLSNSICMYLTSFFRFFALIVRRISFLLLNPYQSGEKDKKGWITSLILFFPFPRRSKMKCLDCFQCEMHKYASKWFLVFSYLLTISHLNA